MTAECTGVGGLARDSTGEVLATFSSSYHFALPPDIAKATALRKALQLCHELGLRDVIFQGDCLKVINAINS